MQKLTEYSKCNYFSVKTRQEIIFPQFYNAIKFILLKYANRFYERQFMNREELSNDLLEQFNFQLKEYNKSVFSLFFLYMLHSNFLLFKRFVKY